MSEAPTAPEWQLNALAGLPRAGSTLLSALLRQNPAIQAGVTSPVGPVIDAVTHTLGAGSELGPLATPAQRRRMAVGIAAGYYADLPDAVHTVFDTNRAWPARLPELLEIAPSARLVCCVRDVPWVLDSLERLYQANPFETTALFDSPAERATVYTRADALTGPDRLVGFAWGALKAAVLGPHAERVLVVEYDDLTRHPAQVMPLIYDFVGLPRGTHDFSDVSLDAPAYDTRLGLPGLHRVEGPVRPRDRAPVMPTDLFDRFGGDNFWQAGADSSASKIVQDGSGGEPSFAVKTFRDLG